MFITVKEKHPQPTPKRSGKIVTEAGDTLDCWDKCLDQMQVRGQYEIETSTNARGYTSITKVKPVGGDVTVSPSRAARYAEAARPIAENAHEHGREDEFIEKILCAYIANGRCPAEKLTETIRYIRKAWQESFRELDS